MQQNHSVIFTLPAFQWLNPPAPGLVPACTSAFAAETLQYCQALSESLLQDPACRPLPELIAFGFWLRRSAMQQLLQPYQQSGLSYKPIGLVLHNTPANVDTLFAYSAVLSLLCGNVNLVRLSNNAGPAALVLTEKIKGLAAQYPAVNARLQLFRCPHQALEVLYPRLDGRVLWGSDDSIQAQRRQLTSPHCRDLLMTHKFSLALFGAAELASATDSNLQSLIERFARDNLTYAQQACSSAKAVIWLGTAEQTAQARQRFWPAFQQYAGTVTGPLNDSQSYQALANAQQLIINGCAHHHEQAGSLQLLTAETLHDELTELHQGCGLFVEVQLEKLPQLTSMLSNKIQTLSHAGIRIEELHQWFDTVCIGIDRLVPVGSALNFSPLWDGQDLVLALSRQIRVS